MSIHTKLLLSACACAAALLSTGQAQASAGTTAEFTNLTFTLTDLDPDDGIAPSFTLPANLGGATITGVGAYIWSGSNYEGPFPQGLDPAQSAFGAPGTGLERSATLGNSEITSRAQGNTYLIISNFAPGQTGSGSYIAGAGIASGSVYDETYGSLPGAPGSGAVPTLLSAHTQLTITAEVTLTLAGTLDCQFCEYESHNALGYLGLVADGDGSYFSGPQVSDDVALNFNQYGTDPLHEIVNLSQQKTLQVSFANQADGQATIRFMGGVLAGGGWSANAIPEPGTYALVGLGLGAAGWWARRRKPMR